MVLLYSESRKIVVLLEAVVSGKLCGVAVTFLKWNICSLAVHCWDKDMKSLCLSSLGTATESRSPDRSKTWCRWSTQVEWCSTHAGLYFRVSRLAADSVL